MVLESETLGDTFQTRISADWCTGRFDFKDLTEGATVVVYNADGGVAGKARLAAGTRKANPMECRFGWSVESPKGSGPFQYEVSDRAPIVFTEVERRAGPVARAGVGEQLSGSSEPLEDAPLIATKAPSAVTPAGQIEYRVSGSGTASVTFFDGRGQISQNSEAYLPWTRTVSSSGGYAGMGFFSVQAQHLSGSGSIRCEIYDGGVRVTANSSSGQYAIVGCEYSTN